MFSLVCDDGPHTVLGHGWIRLDVEALSQTALAAVSERNSKEGQSASSNSP